MPQVHQQVGVVVEAEIVVQGGAEHFEFDNRHFR